MRYLFVLIGRQQRIRRSDVITTSRISVCRRFFYAAKPAIVQDSNVDSNWNLCLTNFVYNKWYRLDGVKTMCPVDGHFGSFR